MKDAAQQDTLDASSRTTQDSDRQAKKPKRKRRRWYILFGFLFLLLGAEVSVRIIAGRDSKFNFRIGAEKEWDPYRRMRWKRNYHAGDFNTNSRGFLGPEFDTRKAPGSYRIVCLGDSTAVIPPHHPYPRALEEQLRKMLPDRHIDVIAGGCSGYDSGQARIWYEREINDIDHDMLIIYLGWNDMGQYNPDGLAYKREEVGMLKQPSLLEKLVLNIYLLRAIYVVQFYIERSQQLSFDPLSKEESEKYANFYPQHFEDNLKAVIALARAKGRAVRLLNFAGLVVEHPTPEEQPRIHFPRGMGRHLPKYCALLAAYNRALIKVSQETGTPIIDCASIFADPKNRTVFTDSCHFDEQGADMFANIVAKSIKADIK